MQISWVRVWHNFNELNENYLKECFSEAKQLDNVEQTEEEITSSDENEDSLLKKEFRMHKDNYYMDKLEYVRVDR